MQPKVILYAEAAAFATTRHSPYVQKCQTTGYKHKQKYKQKNKQMHTIDILTTASIVRIRRTAAS